MIPRRVYNPPIPSSGENRLKGPLLDWDSPSSHTGTVKKRPPSLEATTIVLSPIDSVPAVIKESSVDGNSIATITVAPKVDAVIAAAATTIIEPFENNKEIEIQRKKISLQEITPGNYNPNEKEKGNELLEQNRNYLTSAEALGGRNVAASVQQRKSRLKLPSQLSVNGKCTVPNGRDASTATSECDESNKFGLKQMSGVPKAAYASATIGGRQSSVGPRHPQVQRLKEGLIVAQQQLQQQHPQQQQSQQLSVSTAKNIVTVATVAEHRQRISDNNNKLNELHKNKCKQTAPSDDTSKKYLYKKLPQANKLKFQDSSSSVFTELYRDFPVNYASTAVVESIPLKPPPYCNPPPVPSPSTMPTHKQLANCSSIETSPHKIRLENESERTQVGIGNQQPAKQQQQASMGARKSGTDAPAQTATTSVTPKSDCTTAHRIANELRLKGNFALQKLTNISKLNHKNNRFFMSSSKASATETAASSAMKKNGDDDTSTSGGNSSTATAPTVDSGHIKKDESDKDVVRENLNEYILFNPVRQSDGDSDGVFVKMGGPKSPQCDILTKPEFTSSLFKNIPVRPRKGVPHLENYCLFDPSKDFVNEKEVKRMETLAAAAQNAFIVPHSEYIDEIIYDDQLVYDTLEDESPSANYFTLDPDYIDHVAVKRPVNPNMERHSQQIENIEKIIDDFLAKAESNQTRAELIHLSNQNSPSMPRVVLKKSPQIDKIFRQKAIPAVTSRRTASLPPNYCGDSSRKAKETDMYHLTSVNRARDSKETRQSRAAQRTTIKHSISLPQLQNTTNDMSAVTANGNTSSNEPNYALFNPIPTVGRSVQYKIRHGRPLSTHSDADSGFLSPVTPPEGPNGSNESAPAIVVLQQCDSIQGYIEVCYVTVFHLRFPFTKAIYQMSFK